MESLKIRILITVAILMIGVSLAVGQRTQKTTPAVGPAIKQIDLDGLKTVLKTEGKPRLINFWATWCDPCREEFPELVKIDTAYKGKIDFISVSLDDLEDMGTTVPRFLREMKATMPAYLLHASDE